MCQISKPNTQNRASYVLGLDKYFKKKFFKSVNYFIFNSHEA